MPNIYYLPGNLSVEEIIKHRENSGNSKNSTSTFGDKPWHTEGIKADHPMDNWIQYQAWSILGRYVTVAEAKELYQKINFNTRKYRT